MPLELATRKQVQGEVVLIVEAQLLDYNGFWVSLINPKTVKGYLGPPKSALLQLIGLHMRLKSARLITNCFAETCRVPSPHC